MDAILDWGTDILLSGFTAFGFGALWYNKLGDRWMAAVGRTKEEIDADQDPTPFVIGFVAALLSAAILRALMESFGLAGLYAGGALGAVAGFGLVAPWIIVHYAFAGRPKELWWIDGGHAGIALTVTGGVLGYMI